MAGSPNSIGVNIIAVDGDKVLLSRCPAYGKRAPNLPGGGLVAGLTFALRGRLNKAASHAETERHFRVLDNTARFDAVQ
jgi:hypothetical protein